ncbi:MAG: replicative helicase loader/inhibitor [Negativicutes bacterium]
MTRQEVCALVALASSSYPTMQSRDPRPIVEAWALMLADLDAVVAKAAIIKVRRESKFFPSVAQLVAAAAELDPRLAKLPTTAEAWEEVESLIQTVGPYRAPEYSCDTVKRAVRAIGWQHLCMGENPEADRAHFLRLYESMRSRYREDRENEKVLALSGVEELIKALAGKMGK